MTRERFFASFSFRFYSAISDACCGTSAKRRANSREIRVQTSETETEGEEVNWGMWLSAMKWRMFVNVSHFQSFWLSFIHVLFFVFALHFIFAICFILLALFRRRRKVPSKTSAKMRQRMKESWNWGVNMNMKITCRLYVSLTVSVARKALRPREDAWVLLDYKLFKLWWRCRWAPGRQMGNILRGDREFFKWA